MPAVTKNVSLDEVDQKDAEEIETCFTSGAWKAAYVLAGIALERTLIAHFLTRTDLLQARASLELGDLVGACRHDPKLAKHEAEIAEILLGYRSMVRFELPIHIEPRPTHSTAACAMAVLKRIISVTAVDEPQQPQTAEEIALLAFKPDVAEARLRQLIVTAAPDQIGRLLLKVIPDHTFTLISRADPVFADALVRLCNLFDLAFCFSHEDIQRAVVKAFMAAIEERDPKLLVIETALFRSKYLLFMDSAQRKRMLRHLLARLQNEMSLPALHLVDGLEEFLCDSDDLLAWLRAVVIACLAAPGETATEVRDYAQRAYGRLNAGQQRIIAEKQAAVLRDCELDGTPELGRLLRELQDRWVSPLADTALRRGDGNECEGACRSSVDSTRK